MAAYFDREVELSFSGADVAMVQGLRIAFAIEKSAGPGDNSGVIRVYNLPESARRALARPFPVQYPLGEPVITLFLRAGYVGASSLIFRGVVLRATSQRVGPDWITELEAMTAVDQFTKATLGPEHSYENTFALVIARQLAAVLNWGEPRISLEALTILMGGFERSIAFTGTAAGALRGYLRKYGLEFTVDDDGLLIAPVNRAHDAAAADTAAPVVSPLTGLIGTPRITRQGVDIRTLLNHSLRPMRRFLVESESVSSSLSGSGMTADFFAKSVKHIGDNRGEEWFTDVTGVYSSLSTGQMEKAKAPAEYVAESGG